MQEKEAINKVVRLLTEADSINEQVKEVLDEAKESGLNSTVIKAVASAIVKANTDSLKEKSEAIIKAINVYRT